MKIIIGTHGRFGEELVKSTEMIAGKMNYITCFSLENSMSAEDYRNMIIKTLDSNEEYLVLVDLFGGTPCNVLLSLIKEYNIEILSGVNMPMLLELSMSFSHTSKQTLLQLMLNATLSGAVNVKEVFKNREEVKL